MASPPDTLKLHLKKAGHSMTSSRQEVFDLLAKGSPLTMHALWKKLENSTNRSSIYRTIALFETLGIVQRINHGWKYTLELTDRFVPHHHHFTCTRCHDVISFDEPEHLDEMLNSIAKMNSFEIRSHTLETEGLCSECRVKDS